MPVMTIPHDTNFSWGKAFARTDEDCNFENTWPDCDDGQGTQCASEPSFLRNALLTGLAMGAEGGQNPYKPGVTGPTDVPATVQHRAWSSPIWVNSP